MISSRYSVIDSARLSMIYILVSCLGISAAMILNTLKTFKQYTLRVTHSVAHTQQSTHQLLTNEKGLGKAIFIGETSNKELVLNA